MAEIPEGSSWGWSRKFFFEHVVYEISVTNAGIDEKYILYSTLSLSCPCRVLLY